MTARVVTNIGLSVATLFALSAPAWQALTGWGLSASEFSKGGDDTLRAASYAFSIWGVIYTGLVAHAVYHWFARDRAFASVAQPSALAIAGCGAWILASAADAR